MSSQHIFIQSNRLIVRKTTKEDLDFVLHTEKANTPFVDSWSIDQHQTAMHHVAMEHLILECVSSGEKIGYIILNERNNPHGSLYLKRIVIDVKGKGFGREAIRFPTIIKKMVF